MMVNTAGLKSFVGSFYGRLVGLAEAQRETHNEMFDLGQRIAAMQASQENEMEVVVMSRADEVKKMVAESLMRLGSSHEEATSMANQLKDGKDLFGKGSLANG
jgi:hypothetical protein